MNKSVSAGACLRLSLLALSALPLMGGTLTSFDMPLDFTVSSGVTSIGGSSASASRPFLSVAGTVGNYQVTGHLCMDGWCGGTGVNGQISTPVIMRLTNVQATCTLTTGACGALEFLMSWGAEAPVGAGYTGLFQPVAFALNGSSTSAFTGSLTVGVNGQTSVSSTTALTSGAGAFSFTGAPGSVFVANNSGVFSMNARLTVNGLAAGATFNLPSSFELMAGADATGIPEPGSVLLTASALLLLVGRRWDAKTHLSQTSRRWRTAR